MVIATAAAGAAIAVGLATIVLVFLNLGTITSPEGANLIEIAIAITFALVGGIIAARTRSNTIGWLLLFIALVEGLVGATSQYARYASLTHPGSLPGAAWALWWASASQVLVGPSGAIVLAILLFPDGRLPSRRWRWVVYLGVALTLFFFVVNAFPPSLQNAEPNLPPLPNPVGIEAVGAFSDSPLGLALFILAAATLLVAASAQVVRMRRARGDERAQIKWLAYAVVTTAVLNLVLAVGNPIAPSWWLFNSSIPQLAVEIAGFAVALPVAIGIAILKYRLYDIDIVISRTLVYGSLALFITAVYVGIVVGIGGLIGSGGHPNLVLSIAATAIVAIGFQPVRERLERVANRLVYGKRATPYEVLSQFSERVAETYAADEVLPRMAAVLADGTAAESAAVWLRAGGELRCAAEHPGGVDGHAALPMTGDTLPAIPDADRAVPVWHQGQLLGALSLQKRRGESLTPIEEKLLDDLAGQAGLVLKNVGLTADLQARLEDLRGSRQRLVAAQDQERRRLERNLHDGAQQNLVALKVKLGLAETFADRDPEKTQTLLAQLKDDADEALETLRDLARGIYPPLLADRGLVAALQSQAGKATVAVNVEAEDLGRYPQDVEAAVYFCVLEALQNVQKYAEATGAVVRLKELDGSLEFDVVDDGRGFELGAVARGAGLTNMEDRLNALGGRLTVESTAGKGTKVSGSIPTVVTSRTSAYPQV